MNRMISAVITSSALIFGVFLPSEEAVAQTVKDLVGTWTLVSITFEQDGTMSAKHYECHSFLPANCSQLR